MFDGEPRRRCDGGAAYGSLSGVGERGSRNTSDVADDQAPFADSSATSAFCIRSMCVAALSTTVSWMLCGPSKFLEEQRHRACAITTGGLRGQPLLYDWRPPGASPLHGHA